MKANAIGWAGHAALGVLSLTDHALAVTIGLVLLAVLAVIILAGAAVVMGLEAEARQIGGRHPRWQCARHHHPAPAPPADGRPLDDTELATIADLEDRLR